MTLNEDRVRERAHALWQAAGEPHGQHDEFWFAARRELEGGEDGYDDALADSFPASDPPGNTGITGPETAEATSGAGLSSRTTATEPVADPGGTRPKPSQAAGVMASQRVLSGDRNQAVG